MSLYTDPVTLAEQSFKDIDREAGYAREQIEIDGRTIIIDGSRYSPATRACPEGHYVWEMGTVEDWEIFQDELDQLVKAYAEHGYHLGWEDGCLWLYGPQYCPED